MFGMLIRYTSRQAQKLYKKHDYRLRAYSASTVQGQQQSHVRLVEVGPRDGLQNEKQSVPLETKLSLIERLASTGLQTIEAGSFVSPKWVPQMANSSDILSHLLKNPFRSPVPITYHFLLPNARGLQDFLMVRNNTAPSNAEDGKTFEKSVHPRPNTEISIFTAATESFSKRNINCNIAESIERFKPLMDLAKENDLRVRAYVSVALGCPYEGYVDPHKVASIATTLLELGAQEISIGDTTGMGTAPRTAELLRVLSAAGIRNEDIALHLHDTFGQALVNAAVGLEHGIQTFDAAVSGLGGCPFSPGATGNVATEDLVYMFESLGVKTGVDLHKLSEVGGWISKTLNRPNQSRAGKATLAKFATQ